MGNKLCCSALIIFIFINVSLKLNVLFSSYVGKEWEYVTARNAVVGWKTMRGYLHITGMWNARVSNPSPSCREECTSGNSQLAAVQCLSQLRPVACTLTSRSPCSTGLSTLHVGKKTQTLVVFFRLRDIVSYMLLECIVALCTN